jgi:hypothetical protein
MSQAKRHVGCFKGSSMNRRSRGDSAGLARIHLVAIAGLGPLHAGCSGTASVAPRDGGAMEIDAGCATGEVACSGAQPQNCLSGAWTNAGTACSDATPYCVGGTCSADPPSCSAGGAGTAHCGSDGDSCCTTLRMTPPACCPSIKSTRSRLFVISSSAFGAHKARRHERVDRRPVRRSRRETPDAPAMRGP